jgi:hypothetical protein
MTRVAAIAAIALAAGASPVAAQTRVATTNMPVVGSAPQICTLQPPRLAGALTNFRGLSGETLQIDQMVDSTTLATNAARAEVQFEAVCTFPHRLRVESQNNGLWRTSQTAGATASPGFTYAVPYSAEVSWAGNNTTLDTDALSRRVAEQGILVDEPSAGILNLRIVIQQGASNVRANAPVIAGWYADTLRLVLEPR